MEKTLKEQLIHWVIFFRNLNHEITMELSGESIKLSLIERTEFDKTERLKICIDFDDMYETVLEYQSKYNTNAVIIVYMDSLAVSVILQ